MTEVAPIPSALVLLDYFGIAVFAISGALLAVSAWFFGGGHLNWLLDGC